MKFSIAFNSNSEYAISFPVHSLGLVHLDAARVALGHHIQAADIAKTSLEYHSDVTVVISEEHARKSLFFAEKSSHIVYVGAASLNDFARPTWEKLSIKGEEFYVLGYTTCKPACSDGKNCSCEQEIVKAWANAGYPSFWRIKGQKVD